MKSLENEPVRDAFAGTLNETDSGYSFRYDPVYLQNPEAPSVSLTLPKRSGAYTSAVLFYFFDGLIPEGWLLNIVTRNWKIDPLDRFGLLLVACEDCVGCVRIREVRE
ncbi:MAG: HipA N-terminal domain-containing protein [Oscillospiraceae bacterium]|nr:HipA N-terminal domain-containing protein [Oscillospiraceae bacterium]